MKKFHLNNARATVTLAASILALTCSIGEAQFIQTGASGIYQHTNGSTKVIIGAKNGAQGMFVMDGAPIPPQEFNIETTPVENTEHLFITFDSQAQPPTYSSLVINEKEYKISGNLTIRLGTKTVVGIDNNNPYLTVVTEGSQPGESPAILGFSGLNEIVRGKGALATILAANQLNPEVAKVIHPYSVEGTELTLNGHHLQNSAVGTFVKPENDCLQPPTVILLEDELKKIQTAKKEDEQVQLLEAFMSASKGLSRLKDHLVLKAGPKSVILLDIQDKNVLEMHRVIATSTKRRVCVISQLVMK
jgi:hypothetical protein